MKVFVENEAGSNQKNIYNEKTFEYKKTVTVSRQYPFPYGFIVGTTSGDGDNLDCFILTDKKLKKGELVEVEPIGLMEQGEDGKTDNNVIAIFSGEPFELTDNIKQRLSDFVNHVFDHLSGKVVTVGKFLGKDSALAEIEKSLD